MELLTGQSIYYSNKSHLPLEDVAESLLALKGLIEATPDILERLSPGLHIQKVNVYLNEVRAGSLWEDLIVKFIWGSQEKLSQDVDAWRNGLRVDSIISNRLIIGAIIGALIMGGGIYLLDKLKGPEEQKQTLQTNQNIFILAGANLTGITEEQFKSVIDGAISRKEQIPKDAVKLIRPAKREGSVSITLNRDEATTISSDAIRAMPNMVSNDEIPESIEDFQNIEIQIRAIDLDSTKRGWAAVIPSVDSRRTKMHLDPHIKATNLIGKTVIMGDVTVIFRYDQSGNRIPSLVFLRNVID
ncbi:hypothetical protein [Noviherbaspirillum sp.]|jgi:hypothetical protein|uniref:hypothetical protein n=1 Tax=Noviherbaspirillum sp. TaxID=1926288 RepID=UPI0025CC9E1D|nr:hypothetical protein [Noviherbaspirillum sp.]